MGLDKRMAKAAIGHGRVAKSGLSGVAGLNEGPPPPNVAESICAAAYAEGKTDGVFAVVLEGLAGRLQLSEKCLTEALAAGIGCGWLRQGNRRVELTAAGIYVAKLALKLPT